MAETPFEVATSGGLLLGHTVGRGAPALLLHGGPGLADYLGGCAQELENLFTTIRYTQRGTPPSTVGAPFTIETHMADALAVLDAFELERAWVIGHSWGGHLALHLAVAHPDRFHGLVCIDTLGASGDVLPEFADALKRGLTDAERSRIAELDELEASGEAGEEDFLESLGILWPQYFFDPATAPPPLVHAFGVQCHTDTTRSIEEHFERGTLREGLPSVAIPALFAHGMADPLPLGCSTATAKLIPGAKVGRVPRAGHFPWIEQPGFLNRMLRGLIAQL